MYCILVAGIPASGKSTLSRQLADRMGLPVISKDEIKEILFDRIGFRSRSEKVNLGAAAMEMMYYSAEQMMKAGIPFILENNFEYASMEGLISLIARYRYRVLTITLTGEYQTIYRRFVERNISPDRHRGHVVNDCYPEQRPHTEAELLASTISFEQFAEGIKARGFDEFSAGSERIVVDTTDFSKVDPDELVVRMKQWIAESSPVENE